MTTLTIAIIALIIMIVISTIQAYTNGVARNEQNLLIEELVAKQSRDYDTMQTYKIMNSTILIKNKELGKQIKHKEKLIGYRNKTITKHEKTIAKLTGDKKILRGRKLTK